WNKVGKWFSRGDAGPLRPLRATERSVAEGPYGQAGQVTPNAAVMSGKDVFLIAVCGAVCGATLTLLALALLFQLWLLALGMLLSFASAAMALTRWREWTAGVRKSGQAGLP